MFFMLIDVFSLLVFNETKSADLQEKLGCMVKAISYTSSLFYIMSINLISVKHLPFD